MANLYPIGFSSFLSRVKIRSRSPGPFPVILPGLCLKASGEALKHLDLLLGDLLDVLDLFRAEMAVLTDQLQVIVHGQRIVHRMGELELALSIFVSPKRYDVRQDGFSADFD
jgi:hypothetical protein